LSHSRVVITGLGAITPLGLTVAEFWQGLSSGKNGVAPITSFDTGNYPVKVDWNRPNWICPGRSRKGWGS
jgi:3-oxoacyl-[acyl-carrier-protein] synthase II